MTKFIKLFLNHKFLYSVILILILVIVVATGYLWQIEKQSLQNPPADENSITPPGSQLVDTAKGKKYTDNEYGFELEFSKDLYFDQVDHVLILQNYPSDIDRTPLQDNDFYIEVSIRKPASDSDLEGLSNIKQTKLNDYKSYEADDLSAVISPDGPHIVYVPSPKSDIAVFFTIYTSSNTQASSQINQILSTFNFTN